MGLDLRLLIIKPGLNPSLDRLVEESKNRLYLDNTCFDFISFKRDYVLFGQIEGSGLLEDAKNAGYDMIINPKPLPKNIKFKLFDGEGSRVTRKNPYGDDLTYVLANEFKKLKLSKDADKINKAVMSYIKNLPDDYPIILEWR